MKTAVIYARYSCDNQTEQSIEGQLRVCHDYAERNGILIVETYIDRAMTGTNDMRPDFQRMMKDSGKRQWNYVLVYKLDRFSRNKYEATVHKNTLKNNGVKVLSAMENIPDTPEGIILESLLEGMNQYYSAELSQKVKRGMYETRRKGNFQGGVLPYGYKSEGKKIVIDPERAEAVQFMYEQFSMGVCVRSIIDELTSRGVLYKGKPLTMNTVYGILKNEKYSGIYRIGDEVIDNMYPRIIPQQLYEIVRQKVDKNRFGRKCVKAVYLLRNKVTCGYCGHPISAETGTARNGDVIRYYRCKGDKQYRNGCEMQMIRKEILEEFVVNIIVKELSKKETMDTLVTSLLREQERQCVQNPRLTTLLREKAKVDKALDNLVAALEQGIMSMTTNKRLHELEQQQGELEKEILIEQSKAVVKVPESVIREYYMEALKMESAMLIDLFIRKIVLYNDKIEIYFNTPLRNGPDNDRGCSFFVGVGYLPRVSLHKDEYETDIIKIEMLAG